MVVVSVQMAAEKRYELRVEGHILWNLTEADITEIFQRGRIGSSTPCRISGSTEWRNLDEYFPLLKYGVYAWEGSSSGKQLPGQTAEARPSYVARWRIATACFAAGLLCSGTVAVWPAKETPSEQPQLQRAKQQSLGTFASQQSVASTVPGTPVSTQIVFSTSPKTDRVSRVPKRSVKEPAQSGIPAASSLVSKPAAEPEEITIPLEQWTSVETDYGSFWVKIRDHGPVTISVWLNYSSNPRRIEKEKGFETTGTNIVEIYSLPRAKVYYVDRIGVSSGYCVLKIIPNS